MKAVQGAGRRRVCAPAFAIFAVGLAMVVAAMLLALPGVAGAQTKDAGDSEPVVTGIVFESTPAYGTSYATGETVTIAVTFDVTVDVVANADGDNPELLITVGSPIQNRVAAYTGGDGTDTIRFEYTVAAGDQDNYGIDILPKIVDGGLRSPIHLPAGVRIANENEKNANARISAADLPDLIFAGNPGHRVNAVNAEPPEPSASQPANAGYLLVEWRQPGVIQPDYYLIDRWYAVTPPEAPPARSIIAIRVPGSQRSFQDRRALVDGATYQYRVTGYKGRWHSPDGDTAEATYFRPAAGSGNASKATAKAQREAEGNLPPVATTITDHSITLDWAARTAAGEVKAPRDGAIGYHIYRQDAGAGETGWTTLVDEIPLNGDDAAAPDPNARRYTDGNLRANSVYRYKIFEDHARHAHRIIATVVVRTMPQQ